MECKGGEYIQAVWTSFEVILDVLHTVTNKAEVKTKTQALGLKKKMLSLDFVVALMYGGPQLSRQNQNARIKSKTLASKTKRSRQKQNARVKSKTIASKAKPSRQKQNSRVNSQTLASKLSEHSEANASLRLFCSLAYGGRIFT